MTKDLLITRTWTWRGPRWWPIASSCRSSGAHRLPRAEPSPRPGTGETGQTEIIAIPSPLTSNKPNKKKTLLCIMTDCGFATTPCTLHYQLIINQKKRTHQKYYYHASIDFNRTRIELRKKDQNFRALDAKSVFDIRTLEK